MLRGSVRSCTFVQRTGWVSAFNEGIEVSIHHSRNIFAQGYKGVAKSYQELADLVGLQIFVPEGCNKAVDKLAVVRSVCSLLYYVGKSV